MIQTFTCQQLQLAESGVWRSGRMTCEKARAAPLSGGRSARISARIQRRQPLLAGVSQCQPDSVGRYRRFTVLST